MTRTVELMSKQLTETLPTDTEGLRSSFAKLESVISQTSSYVDDVVVNILANSDLTNTFAVDLQTHTLYAIQGIMFVRS